MKIVQTFCGYILVEHDYNYLGPDGYVRPANVYPYLGIESMHLWPLDDFFEVDKIAEEFMMERWNQCEGLQAEGAIKNIEYIKRYAQECQRRGILLDICAVGVDEGTVISDFKIDFEFMGYDCVSEDNVVVSYLYADGLTIEECKEHNFIVNRFGLLSSEYMCENYGLLRRRCIEQGEDWEDCGKERAVGFAKSRFIV